MGSFAKQKNRESTVVGSEFPDIHIVQFCCHIEVFTVEGSAHRLPSGGDRSDELPMVLIAHLDRHGKCRLVGLPAIRDRVGLRIKAQLEGGNGSMAEIFVEDGS